MFATRCLIVFHNFGGGNKSSKRFIKLFLPEGESSQSSRFVPRDIGVQMETFLLKFSVSHAIFTFFEL